MLPHRLDDAINTAEERRTHLLNLLMTTVFAEQPLVSPGSVRKSVCKAAPGLIIFGRLISL